MTVPRKRIKKIVMLGTRSDGQGGIASVVNVYRGAGLFERYPIEYLATHGDGGIATKLFIFSTAYIRFMALLISGNIDVMHVHFASRASFWRKLCFLVPAYIFRTPVILHLHGAEFSVFYEQECGSIAKRMVRYAFDSAARVVVLSMNWQKWVQSISKNKFVVPIYNPVIPQPHQTSWEERVYGQILFLGRLGKRKGVYDLLSATARIKANCPTLKLHLGGDGELAQVTNYAHELGLEGQVEMLGWVSGKDKENELNKAWLYALPSYHEGLPMSILEAMAAGLPILSTPIAGIPEAVTDGVEGFLVPPGDVELLADRLGKLLNEPGLARQMGAAARKKVEETFSCQVVLPKLECMYSELGIEKCGTHASA